MGQCHLVCGQWAGGDPKDPEAKGTSHQASRAQQTLGKKRLHFSHNGLPSRTQRARVLTGQMVGKSNCIRGTALMNDTEPATSLHGHLPGFLFPSVQNSLHLFKFWLLPMSWVAPGASFLSPACRDPAGLGCPRPSRKVCSLSRSVKHHHPQTLTPLTYCVIRVLPSADVPSVAASPICDGQ